jgi:hypothetical protein
VTGFGSSSSSIAEEVLINMFASVLCVTEVLLAIVTDVLYSV